MDKPDSGGGCANCQTAGAKGTSEKIKILRFSMGSFFSYAIQETTNASELELVFQAPRPHNRQVA